MVQRNTVQVKRIMNFRESFDLVWGLPKLTLPNGWDKRPNFLVETDTSWSATRLCSRATLVSRIHCDLVENIHCNCN